MVIIAVLSCVNLRVGNILGLIFSFLYAINLIAWLIVGGIWRYSWGGSVAAGDKLERDTEISDEEWKLQLEEAVKDRGYQLSSGFFMKVYITVMFWLILTTIIVLIVGSLAYCVYKEQLKYAQESNQPLD